MEWAGMAIVKSLEKSARTDIFDVKSTIYL